MPVTRAVESLAQLCALNSSCKFIVRNIMHRALLALAPALVRADLIITELSDPNNVTTTSTAPRMIPATLSSTARSDTASLIHPGVLRHGDVGAAAVTMGTPVPQWQWYTST